METTVNGNNVTFDVLPGTITVTAVPKPASILLLGSVMLIGAAAILLRRRHHAL